MKPFNVDGEDVLLDHTELERKIHQSTKIEELLLISDKVAVFYKKAEQGRKKIEELEKKIVKVRLSIPQQHTLFNLKHLIKDKIGDISVKTHLKGKRNAG